MNTHNFVVGPTDTDSLSWCKQDMSKFTKEEIDILLKELNDLSPEFMIWEDDGYYPACLVIKAKNYILVKEDGTKIVKGSAFKDQKAPPMFRQFKADVADYLLTDRGPEIITLYNSYIKATKNIIDIQPYSKKITITDKVLKPTRTNEQKQLDALNGKKVQMGDKAYIFFKQDKSLSLVEDFNGDYDRNQLLKNLYMSLKIFANVLDITQYPNYTLKKNKALLEQVDNE